MRDRIIAELSKIEKEQDVQIIYACESGSRAWGFPSKDSNLTGEIKELLRRKRRVRSLIPNRVLLLSMTLLTKS